MNVECHAHIALDGVSYAAAAARNANQPDEQAARAALSAYRAAGITFVRDGGDKWGVSALAKQLAPEYGIDYRTPLFAIHKRGHYGSIVGRAFDTLTDYASLVDEAERHGADFIKIMTTGIMDFDSFGRITGQPLEREEVCEMVHIAHEHGLAVMSHTNGRDAFLDAIEAGADSIEHGNYIDDDC
ncbi:MAG: amidohydrolase family protein, partial [Eggerthellaceae bacterium]|nr:amidohydrolase family protein [Eggerthellaceae bacterium]